MPRLELDSAGRIYCPTEPGLVRYESPWPSPNGTPGGFVEPGWGMVCHTEVGYEHNVEVEFENPSAQASAFCSIPMDERRIDQYGPIGKGWMAWTQRDGNPHFRGVEGEDRGNPSNPYTANQVELFASVFELLSRVDRYPLQVSDDPTGTRRGLITHEDGGAAWGGHACPGPVRSKQRQQIVARAQQIRDEGASEMTPQEKAQFEAELVQKIGDALVTRLMDDKTHPNTNASLRAELDQVKADVEAIKTHTGS